MSGLRIGILIVLITMQREAYVRLDLSESTAVMAEIVPRLDGVIFDPARATVLAASPSFYPGWRILDISDHSVMPVSRRCVVSGPGDTVVLDGTAASVTRLNRLVPVHLDAKNIGDYVRFYLAHISGPHGRLIVVEGPDDIPWHSDPPTATRKSLNEMITPLTVLKNGKRGPFQISLCVVFRSLLMGLNVSVTSDGAVRFGDEEILLDDLPVADEILEG